MSFNTSCILVLVVLAMLFLPGHGQKRRHYGDGGEPEVAASSASGGNIESMIQCPVCDYGVAFVTREVALREVFCRSHSAQDLDSNATLSALFCERTATPNALRVSDAFALESLLDLCFGTVGHVFPATEQLFSKDDAAQRKEVEAREKIDPIDSRFIASIEMACRKSIDRRRIKSLATFITTIATGIDAGALLKSEDQTRIALFRSGVRSTDKSAFPSDVYRSLDLSLRRRIYTAVIAAQEKICHDVCGDIPRPRTLAPPRAAGFNAFGKHIRVHEHLTFDEAEVMREH